MALLTELYSTTRLNRDMSVADMITNHNALLFTLEDMGAIKNATGGRTLDEPLIHTGYDSSTVKFYSGYESFSVDTSQEVVTAASYAWKQLGGFTFISGREEHQNRGKQAAVDLLKAKDDALIATLRNAAETSLFSDGTGTGGLEFGGLQLLVAKDPTAAGTPGGIDQAANTFWRNQTSGDVTVATTWSAVIQGEMNEMWLSCLRGADATNLIVGDSLTYTGYWESLQANQRFTSPKYGEAGFDSLMFKSAPVVYAAGCPSNTMYFLNTNYIRFRKSPGRFFSDEAPQVVQSADYTLFPNWTMGNLTMNDRARQGVIYT